MHRLARIALSAIQARNRGKQILTPDSIQAFNRIRATIDATIAYAGKDTPDEHTLQGVLERYERIAWTIEELRAERRYVVAQLRYLRGGITRLALNAHLPAIKATAARRFRKRDDRLLRKLGADQKAEAVSPELNLEPFQDEK